MKSFFALSLGFLLAGHLALAQSVIIDSDLDGLSDADEVSIYKTNPLLADTDNDGYPDGVEIKNGYAPLNKKKTKLTKNDFDKDGLSDAMEIKLGSNLNNPDSNGNGVKDGQQFYNGINPQTGAKLIKAIKVNTAKQEIEYFTGNFNLGKFRVSTGKRSTPTPKGEFKIVNKAPRAWSKKFGLWMPYWMGMKDGSFGFHELPEWPNGYKEGEKHIGTPVSHGCIRLGVGDAKKLYDWVEVGTKVIIK